MKNIFLFTLTFIVLLGCSSDNGVGEKINVPEPPEALFSVSKTVLNAGETIVFTDESLRSVTFNGTFEGGDPENSTAKNPNVPMKPKVHFR